MMISKKNKKLGMIPSFSISTTSCSKTGTKQQQCKRYCYARRIEKMRPSVKNRWRKNLRHTKQEYFIDKIWEEIQFVGDYIRIHVAGDFYNQTYLNKWMKIARMFPHKTFYTYTKAIELNYTKRPNNLIILLSDDKGIWKQHRWRFDGTTTFQKENNQVECKGQCDKCLICPDGTRTQTIIKFKKR